MIADNSDLENSYLLNNNVKNHHQYDIIVFCHLRWGFVYQRPQHIISRLSKTNNILFVEEPIPFSKEEEFQYNLEEISESLHVLKPKVSSIKDISKILKRLHPNNTIMMGWFYSAAFGVLIPDFTFNTIVYDCMDELSMFKGAAKELIDQEIFLLANADVVFTGGTALYESKVNTHSNVHCFPSSVDQNHFEKALTALTIPSDIINIQKPIVGYFGVIDERIDMDLLYQTAINLPAVSFVMIGPLAKIGEENLPRATNIHYLGMKSYEVLPNYLKAFDIAMMPFALNDATRFISPTKTLEYMAAGVPIVSTAIKDVVRHYDDCTYIITNSYDFAKSIHEILYNKIDNREDKYSVILANTSWDSTVEKMENLIMEIKI